MYEEQKKIKDNEIVEVITLKFQRLVGLVRYNKENYISLVDPCIINIKKVKDEKNNTVHFNTDMLPYRLIGDENFALFNYNNLSSVSIVSSENFINMQNRNVTEFGKLYLHSK